MTPPAGSKVDPALLELFRSELTSHSQVLEKGLSGVVNGQNRENLDSLIRAVHSLKGAARIVGLPIVVTLAAAMEEVMEAGRSEHWPLPTGHNEALKKAGALFLRLASKPVGELVSTLETESVEIKSLAESLRAPSAESTPVPPVPVAPATLPPVPTAVPPSAPPVTPATAPSASGSVIDGTLLEMFRGELETHAHALENGLVGAEKRQTPDAIEPLMRAAHSIKGAARIVGMDGAVGLAHAMEDLLQSVRKGQLRLTADHVDLLLKANDVYLRLAALKPADMPNALAAWTGETKPLQESLRAAPQGGSAVAAGPLVAPSAPSKPGGETVSEPSPGPAAAPSSGTGSTETGPSRERLDRDYVRVQANKLDRLLGLAGECLVQANSAKSFATPLQNLNSGQRYVGGLLEKLEQIMADLEVPDVLKTVVSEILTAVNHDSEQLDRHMANIDLLSRRLEGLSDRLYREVAAVRMRPISECTLGFPRMIRDLAKGLGKQVDFQIHGGDTLVDSNILTKLEAPLTHLLRNALDHGLETPDERCKSGKAPEGRLTLEAVHRSGLLEITVSDDGRGIDPEKLRKSVQEKGYVTPEMAAHLSHAELIEFLFLPGFSMKSQVTEISGRGVGLDVVLTMLQEIGGVKTVESTPGKGIAFRLQLPVSLSVLRTLLVEIDGQVYGFNLTRIDRLVEVPPEDIFLVEDRPTIVDKDEQIGMVMASQVLGLNSPPSLDGKARMVVISDRLNRFGVVVDRFLGERDLVVIPLDPRLGRIPNISAGAILDDGLPVLLFDVGDLVRSIANLLASHRLKKFSSAQAGQAGTKKTILVVDDSLTVREVQRRLLENHGYAVTLGVDGVDGWNIVQQKKFALVISDIDMPRMNGIEFVGRIKSNPLTKDVPVMIVSYKDREEDRMAGLRAGANYYLTKSSFHDETLLKVVTDLIGEP